TEGRTRIRAAVVVEAPEVRARRPGRGTSVGRPLEKLTLGAELATERDRRVDAFVHELTRRLPRLIHSRDAEGGVAPCMPEEQLQLRVPVDDTAAHDRTERQRALGEVSDRVIEVVPIDPRDDDGVAALVEEDDRAKLLGRLPERYELRLVEGTPV